MKQAHKEKGNQKESPRTYRRRRSHRLLLMGSCIDESYPSDVEEERKRERKKVKNGGG